MKTKAEKQKELDKGRKLFRESKTLIFTDFTGIGAEDLRRLRGELKKIGSDFLVIKKRLLNLLLKEKGVDFDARQLKFSLGTIFSKNDLENIGAPVYKFFSTIEVPDGAEKDLWIKHILGGHDLKTGMQINSSEITFIGKLPPREVLLAQLLGIIAAPIKSLLYLLDQKTKRSA